MQELLILRTQLGRLSAKKAHAKKVIELIIGLEKQLLQRRKKKIGLSFSHVSKKKQL